MTEYGIGVPGSCYCNFHCIISFYFINYLLITQADPLMGRAYLSERATGGAVKSLPMIGEDLGVVRGPP